MNAPSSAKLYSPQMLQLATELADFPLTDDMPLRFEARSQTCGSTVNLGVCLDGDGKIDNIGLRTAACAVGQAASAIFAQGAIGKTKGQLAAALRSIPVWLNGQGELPRWPGFDVLVPARSFSGRHGAIMLPWEAALGALSMDEKPS